MRLTYTLLLSCIVIAAAAQQKNQHTVYFDFDKDVPTSLSQKALLTLIDQLRVQSVTAVEVKGYTDFKGNHSYNEKLSQRRAEHVAAQLKSFLPSIPISIVFFGEEGLISTNDDQQDRNRRVEISCTYASIQPATMKITEVQSIKQDVEEQVFTANVSDTILVKGKLGTTIKIPPGSLQTKSGKLVTGGVEIILKEYYEPGAILLAGMHSVSNNGLLQTGGMFTVVIRQGSEVLSDKMKKNVEIRLPVRDESLTNMDVFTQDSHSDSNQWRNSGRRFSQTFSYWAWPMTDRLYFVNFPEYVNFEKYRVGAMYRDDYHVDRPLIAFGDQIPHTKKVNIELKKIDSLTLRVNAKLQYRKRGFKKFGIRTLDTTYTVPFQVAEYYASVGNLNYINCDRFWKYTNKTEFFVATPGFKGLNVAVYFKSQSAYMPSAFIGDRYVVRSVPANEKVIVVAYGKNDDRYFFGRHSCSISDNGMVSVTPIEMTKDEFDKSVKAL